MNNHIFFVFVLLISLSAFGQKTDSIPDKGADSIKTNLKKRGVVVQEASFEKVEINPLAPSKAAFYSAVFPGLGQVYNKRYWKVPIVYGALGLSIYTYSINNTNYKSVRRAFKSRLAGFTSDEFYPLNTGEIVVGSPRVSDTALQDAQERYQRDRDLALLVTIGLYVLNVIDANVDAHLKQYNVSDQLSMDVKPFLQLNEVTGSPNYGLAMQIKF